MQIHEQAHIVVATLAGGFIDAEPCDLREISSLTGLVHIMVHDAPQTRAVEHLYDQDFDRDSNTIEVFIGRLRKKIPADMIKTVRGLGYRLTQEPDEA